MLIFVTLAALLLAALGLGTVRTAPAVARWLALLSALAFAVVASLADNTAGRRVTESVQEAQLLGTTSAQRTNMLLAAARSGPRADEIDLVWQEATGRLANDDGTATLKAFGARALAPAGLPFAPEDVRIRARTALRAERPAMLEVEVVGLAEQFPADLIVRDGKGPEYRERLDVGAAPATVGFTPARAGNWQVALEIAVGDHIVLVEGAFEVAPPDEILVVDQGGIVAAALRAQGENVRETTLLPSDWRRHDRIVLGRVLPVEQQRELVWAVDAGTGLFVLGSAFGDDGMPLREVLPVRPLPVQPKSGDGPGGRGNGEPDEGTPAKPVEQPGKEPPPDEQPPEKPPAAQPPPNKPDGVGATEGAKDVSKDPIEVDRHSVAMVLIVDRSQSMGQEVRPGLTRMSFAKTSALRTARALDVGDRVGVVTFGNRGTPRVELPMTDATDDAAIRAGIAKLGWHVEYTFLLSAVVKAHEMLRNEDAAVKHVVVISDGEFRDQTIALRREAHRMRTDGKITLSIISIIDDLTPSGFKVNAQEIAKDGGGMFLATRNAQKVPVIVSTEVTRALSRVGRQPRKPGDGPGGNSDKPQPDRPQPDKPEPDKPEPDEPEPDKPTELDEPEPDPRLVVRAVVDSPLLAPEPDEWPTLGAAVRADAPLESRVLLVVGDEGAPLLAYANRGLGRVGAFCGDLAGDSGSEFRSAEAFPGWLAQWLAATTAAVATTESRDLRDKGEVEPPTTVPADIRWLTAVSGGSVSEHKPGRSAMDFAGKAVVDQVAPLAPWLIAVLLLLAIGERTASFFALRRGRS